MSHKLTIADDSGSLDLTVLRPTSFCNPVDVDRHGIVDPAAHLTCYKVESSGPDARKRRRDKRMVVAHDSFGTHNLAVGTPQRLCVPSELSGMPADAGVDSFACFSAAGQHLSVSSPPVVSLVDAFETKRTFVLSPLAVCEPVTTGSAPAVHPGTGMVCFAIDDLWTRPPQPRFQPRTLTVQDLFGVQSIDLVHARKLCIPAKID